MAGSPRTAVPRRRSLRAPLAVLAAAAAMPLAAGCATPPDATTIDGAAAPAREGARDSAAPAADTRLPLTALPGWADDPLDGLRAALARQCALRVPPVGWREPCASLPADDAALRGWLQANFVARPLRDARGERTGLATGYHEPLLTGSRRRESTGQVPLYRRPADLVAGASAAQRARRTGGGPEPYWTRAQIETLGPLAGQELVWLDDPVEAFFLQVQGSGRVRLRDGSTLRVGFADHNGQPYRAIGRILVERGELDLAHADAPGIKAWLRAHPDRAAALMRENPRYVFFRALPDADPSLGPVGSLGVPLTARRSVAADPHAIPAGALLFADTLAPGGGAPMRRLLVAQDTGAAIVGPLRIDVFFGSDEAAEHDAGLMREPLRLWLLEPAAAGRTAAPGS